MRINQVEGYIIRHFFSENREERKYGLLFLGPPGIGKSYSVEAAAMKIAQKLNRTFVRILLRWQPGKGFVVNMHGKWAIEDILNNPEQFFPYSDFRLSTIEPSDLTGIPREHNGMTRYFPLEWAAVHSASPGIIFLDEITWIQRDDVWAVAPQVVLDKIAGFTAFHPETLIIAAGNRPEDASIVRLIHNPLMNRFKKISVKSPTVDGWKSWMFKKYGNKWDTRTYAFLKRFEAEGYLLKLPKEPEGLENFPTPRTWTWVALDLAVGFDEEDDIKGLLGPEVGQKFLAFLKTNVNIEELIKYPHLFRQLDLDQQYMACVMLGSWISQHKKEFNKAVDLIDVMADFSKEFLVLTCISIKRRVIVQFLQYLLKERPQYGEALEEIVRLKDSIA